MRDEDAMDDGCACSLTPMPAGETARGLSATRRVKAILFDVYGTLVTGGSGGMDLPLPGRNRRRALVKILQRYGIDKTPERLADSLRRTIENDHRRRKGEGIDHPEVDIVRVWETVLGTGDTAWVKTFALAYETVVNPIRPMPGLGELLSACRRQNLPLGIISNAQFYTPRLLEGLLGNTLEKCGFDPQLIFFSYRFGIAKPSRFMFDLAAGVLARRGISAASVLYVGNDMRNDILPAKTVGFQTALFAGDRRSLRRRTGDACCRHLVPDMVVTGLRQLIGDADNP